MTVDLFEIIGVSASILGAWFMSKGFSVKRNAVMTFSFFLIANVFLFNMAVDKMLIPLMVQMVFFTYFALNGLKNNSPELMKTAYSALGLAAAVTLIHLLSVLGKEPVLVFSPLEFIAAFCAVLGNVFLANNNPNVRVNAFYLFLLADSVYVYIGLENSLYFFAVQAVYFLITSLRAITNTRPEIVS